LNLELLSEAVLKIAELSILAKDAWLIHRMSSDTGSLQQSFLKTIVDRGRSALVAMGVGLGGKPELVEWYIANHFFAEPPTEKQSREFIELMLNGGEREEDPYAEH